MQLRVRRQGAVRSTTATVVVGISEESYREILGFNVALREIGESWKSESRAWRSEASEASSLPSAARMRDWGRLYAPVYGWREITTRVNRPSSSFLFALGETIAYA